MLCPEPPSGMAGAVNLQGLIGHFINVLAVRTEIEEGDTFVGLVLKCAQVGCHDMHQALPQCCPMAHQLAERRPADLLLSWGESKCGIKHSQECMWTQPPSGRCM